MYLGKSFSGPRFLHLPIHEKALKSTWDSCSLCLAIIFYPDVCLTAGEGNGNPLQYSCLENPMDRKTWQATVCGVASVGYDLATKLPPLKFTLEREMATHSSILVWRIPWTEEPGGLQSMGSQRVRHGWVTITHTHTHTWLHVFPSQKIHIYHGSTAYFFRAVAQSHPSTYLNKTPSKA